MSGSEASTSECGAGRAIVCLWACAWTGLWQRHQQLMSRLAAERRVFYVESPRDAWSVLRSFVRGQLRIGQFIWGREALRNVVIFSPVVPFSLRRYPRLNRLYLTLLAPWLRRLLRRWDCPNPVLWVCYPMAESLVGELGEAFAAYDCCDDLTDLSGSLAEIIRGHEERLLQKVRQVIVTSERLFESFRNRHHTVQLIPNGADYAHFARAASEGLPCPPELAALPRPIIGFVGSVQHWVDVQLMAEAARRKPEWSWVVIGGIHKDVSPLQALRNVQFLGTKAYADLPAYLKQIAVGLVPFESCPIVEAADPIKVYEYLAAGKPVVASDIPRLKHFGSAVRIARNAGELILQIEDALAEDSAEAARQRMELARANSWDERVVEISRRLGGA